MRRLAAILAADVAGYSRLMGADEEGTHERVKTHLGQLVNPKVEEHRGRIVKNTGDGFLAEFASVMDAVRCAWRSSARWARSENGSRTLPRNLLPNALCSGTAIEFQDRCLKRLPSCDL
jgi:class 3 adenylate cyclase